MRKTLLFPAVLIVLLAGCRQREDLTQLKAINQSLQYTNGIIQEENAFIGKELLYKKHDLQRGYEAVIWEPKASRIQKDADAIVDLIEELKKELLKQSDSLKEEKVPLIEQLYVTDGPGYKLLGRLIAFKDCLPAIIHVDGFVDVPYKYTNLKKEIPQLYAIVPLLPGYADSLNAAQRKQYAKKWLEENFSGTSAGMALVMLNKMENDLLTTTNTFMDFCLKETQVRNCGWPNRFSGVVTLSSSYVKQGQSIEVNAGVGEFSGAMRPRITMNGKEVKLDDYATAVHRFTANGKPGKHSIDVKFEFIKPDGTNEAVSKKLEYIIAENK